TGIAAIGTFVSCEKSEIKQFTEKSSINFEYFVDKKQHTWKPAVRAIEYSFLTNPTGEVIQAIPVIISGNTVDYDREFTVEVVDDETTTARPDQYEILGGKVGANRFVDTLRIKLYSSDELNNSTATIKLRLVESDDFNKGVAEKQEFTVSWTNKVIVPAWGVYFRTFFTAVGSTQAYRIFVQTTGLTNFAAAQYRVVLQPGAEALGTVFGDYIMQWNKDNPNDILRQDRKSTRLNSSHVKI